MDIQKFVARRKALKISQVKLSTGICTQATLSKFERRGRVPSLAILEQLCGRLGLTVDDLNESRDHSVTQVRAQLDEIERQLMMENYQPVLQALKQVQVTQIEAVPLKMQFYYLSGLLKSLINGAASDVCFDFDQILDDLDQSHETVFTPLAYVGLGVMYSRLAELEKAQFYFEKVHQAIEQLMAAVADQDYLRLLTMIFYTAEYYSMRADFATSNQLIDDGVNLCSSQHVTYYLPRLKYLAAANAIERQRPDAEIQQLLSEAVAFARINHNQVVEVKTAALRSRYLRASKRA
ncbi:helix-turn-helix domain-containing protein [Lactobacillus pentosus]|mgnify:FL=1|jgi:transcriptional regulator with XRE-family HTH domain|uniref:helix-turn-helix domain-containing protein n=1 Tax=Lactiplantibacillus pentosus TaxID=1589 RepID=UPI000D013817|nr:helix-turn-helix transcriptional regulator [Lactiplantibacillus pentosus]BBM20336.1 Xre family transcriptional regulator [Lactiplantibacillus plantarum]MCT3294516.1 XRE family transcriptional regulator [Lactiplantibacillus pentosus]MPQ18354.1 helix-turn-helix domain-containing protein [Lactiplantibacillus pentosus]PRO83942.1 transcriptional regulator [Lactiplantibacillus pentosus]UXI98625.1 helix-turn-helix transcriptional regulator [Lactiplantibacillus pentosus]